MSGNESVSAEGIARTVGETMYRKDTAAQHLGIALKEIGPGRAVMTMRVLDYMLNGHRICHGGYVFTLADTAFAYACNSYNQNTVAQAAQINFIQAVPENAFLTATAVEMTRTDRTGLYDITVQDKSGKTVALFRGNSHTIKGQMIPGLNERKEK
ncbi:hydroxyphenylacetyl-CoA thioesterase PaaI [Sneathiella litorea]|uniref:Hydroxyphenylacetyl-CoA thioesterase PaaI n=1 Tax=Sneathiella litorea TaxID=2606216 RepID=A0A6L8W5Y0_9PROT|nr:hydroxyphenylacetyl-CoA thioesterase PaaI [Sneathiella litorea]MZR30546.1 hydroxyphenylacetyl-CoA thioesterase PaaI [Sneathiella litorea]